MSRRVVITGAGAVTALGNSWQEIRSALLKKENAVKYMQEWEQFKGLGTRLAAVVTDFKVPEHYTRKKIRSMSPVSLFAVRATEFALEDAGLKGDPVLGSGRTGIAYGSCAGGMQAMVDFSSMLTTHSTASIDATTYVKMMPHTAVVNTAIFFGLRGRLIPTSSACTSGSQAIGFAYESIRYGSQDVMVAGGAEELTAADAAIFDTLYATSQKNDTPKLTPAPFDADRDGLVLGEGGCSLILEEYEHAKARGAKIYGEIIGFCTNCDAAHVTHPSVPTMQVCLEQSLAQAGLAAGDVGYISAHGTATQAGDVAESTATSAVFGDRVPFSSLKSYFGHTLGACGALEIWLTVEMMRENWFCPTLNLRHVDPACAPLDYIMQDIRSVDCEFIQSNNFAFGGINTSIVIKRL